MDALQAQGEALLKRHWRLYPVTRMAIPPPESQWHPAIATHAETQQYLFELATPVFTVALGRPRRSRRRRFVRIRPLERHGRRVLMQPGRGNRIALQGFQGNGTHPPLEIGGNQRLQDVSSPVIIEGSTC